MHWNPYCPGLVSKRPGDGLSYPPCRIRTELVSPFILKLVHSPHKADIPLLNQVGKAQAFPYVSFRYADYKPEVGLSQLAFGHFNLPLLFTEDTPGLLH